MKKILKSLIIIVVCFISISNVHATASKFSSLVDYDYDLDQKEIYITLGFDGEPAYNIEQSIKYDDKYVDLIRIDCLEDFQMVKNDSSLDGNEKKEVIACESQSIYDDTEYLQLVFKMNDKFKVGKSAYITVKDIVATGEEYKYRDMGTYIIVRRENPLELTIIPKSYNDSIKFRLWMEENIVWICFGFLALILFVIFVFMPTIARRESKDARMRRQISKNHKMSKSIKKIELEKEKPKVEVQEDSFNPFKDNVSKTSEDVMNNSDDLQKYVDAFEMKKRVKADFSSAFEEFTEIEDDTNAETGNTDTIINQQVEKAANKITTSVQNEEPKEEKKNNSEEDLILFNPISLDSKNDDNKGE